MTLKRSVIREVKEQPINMEPQDGCWVHDTREPACDLCESNANPIRYPDGDAGILLYRADELMVLRAMAPDHADELARIESAIRSVGQRLSVAPARVTSERWEATARKAMGMYDWSKSETRAINDFILTVRESAAELLAEETIGLSAFVEELRADVPGPTPEGP